MTKKYTTATYSFTFKKIAMSNLTCDIRLSTNNDWAASNGGSGGANNNFVVTTTTSTGKKSKTVSVPYNFGSMSTTNNRYFKLVCTVASGAKGGNVAISSATIKAK